MFEPHERNYAILSAYNSRNIPAEGLQWRLLPAKLKAHGLQLY